MTKPYIISIEGNIGTGKSTFLENLELNINKTNPDISKSILFLKEPVGVWEKFKDEHGQTVLEKFYKDQRRYAFTFQVMAYITRLSLLKRAIKENPQCKIVIIERSLIADKNIFMQMLHDDGQVEKMEYDIYNQWYEEFIDEYRVDAIIYLDSNADVCAKRINQRNRTGEEGIPLSYLEKCQAYHTKWLVDTIVAEEPTIALSEHILRYKINHENFIYQMLRVNTNSNTKYEEDGSNNVGMAWLSCVKQFVCDNI